MKRRSFLGIMLASTLCVAFLSPLEGLAAGKKIGVVSWDGQNLRYMTVYNSMVAQLKKEGFDDSKVAIVLEDAQGKKERAIELAKKLHGTSDVIVALGTAAAVPVSKEVTDKPVVFGMVYDPINSKIIKDWKSSGNNVTGASNFVSLPIFIRRLVKRSEGIYPIKKIDVILTPGEKNTELQAQAVKSVEQELGLNVNLVSVTTPEEVQAWASGFNKSKADLVFVTGGVMIAKSLPTIVEATTKAKVWTASHLDDLVERGVLMGLVAEPSDVGTLAGKALAKVLSGTNPSDVPVEYPLPKMQINKKTCDAGGFQIPPAIQHWAQGG